MYVRQKRLDRKARDVHNALWASCEETSNHKLLHIDGDCKLCSWQKGTKLFWQLQRYIHGSIKWQVHLGISRLEKPKFQVLGVIF